MTPTAITDACDERTNRFAAVNIRCIEDLRTPRKVLLERMYFEGLDVLRCFKGRYRFVLDDAPPIFLGVGEALVIYPGHHVSIEALDEDNRLVYGIFTGDEVEDYFSSLGFYDGMRGKTSSQLTQLTGLRRMCEKPTASSPNARSVIIAFLTDILITFRRDLHGDGGSLVHDAVMQIRSNFQRGIVRLEPLCESLHICRSYLHRIFVQAGLGSPASFVKAEQMRVATSLLRTTKLPISEVAKRVGFVSVAHFAVFVRSRTGLTPTQVRRGKFPLLRPAAKNISSSVSDVMA